MTGTLRRSHSDSPSPGRAFTRILPTRRAGGRSNPRSTPIPGRESRPRPKFPGPWWFRRCSDSALGALSCCSFRPPRQPNQLRRLRPRAFMLPSCRKRDRTPSILFLPAQQRLLSQGCCCTPRIAGHTRNLFRQSLRMISHHPNRSMYHRPSLRPKSQRRG